MILASNRVPGQFMPVGARYWENAGQPINALKTLSGLGGLGDDLDMTNTNAMPTNLSRVGTGVIIAAVLIRGGLGYVAGRAMAPSAAKKNSYGWWGVLAGGVFGVTGLAVQGAVALSKK